MSNSNVKIKCDFGSKIKSLGFRSHSLDLFTSKVVLAYSKVMVHWSVKHPRTVLVDGRCPESIFCDLIILLTAKWY